MKFLRKMDNICKTLIGKINIDIIERLRTELTNSTVEGNRLSLFYHIKRKSEGKVRVNEVRTLQKGSRSTNRKIWQDDSKKQLKRGRDKSVNLTKQHRTVGNLKYIKEIVLSTLFYKPLTPLHKGEQDVRNSVTQTNKVIQIGLLIILINSYFNF